MMQHPLSTILLATDGSADATLAERAAADLAMKTGAALHVIHTWEPMGVAPYSYVGMADSYYDPLIFESDARAVLDKSVHQIEARGGKIAGQHLRMGRTVDEIAALAASLDADLICIGSRGLGPVRRLVLGSVSEGLVHTADRPVLIMRGGEAAWPPAQLVIGDDGSRDAARAAELASTLAALCGASATLVYAIPGKALATHRDATLAPASPIFAVSGLASATLSEPTLHDELIAQAYSALQERAIALAGRIGSEPHVVTAFADAATLLLDTTAADPQPALLVVGSRGLGSVEESW